MWWEPFIISTVPKKIFFGQQSLAVLKNDVSSWTLFMTRHVSVTGFYIEPCQHARWWPHWNPNNLNIFQQLQKFYFCLQGGGNVVLQNGILYSKKAIQLYRVVFLLYSTMVFCQENGILQNSISGQQHYQDFRQLFEHFRILLQKGVFKFPFPGFVFHNKLVKVARWSASHISLCYSGQKVEIQSQPI